MSTSSRGSAFQRQILDDIEGIQFRRSCRHVRKIPACGRRTPAHPAHRVQRAVSFKNPADRAQAGQLSVGPFDPKRVADGLRAHEAQIALAQFPAQGEHAALHAVPGLPSMNAGRVGLIRPVHPVQVLPAGADQPVLQVPQTNAQTPCHGALRRSAPYRRHHRPPFIFSEFFIARTLPD